MSKPVTIALDAMGGDTGCAVIVPAALHAMHTLPDLHVILVGDQDCIQAELGRHPGADNARLSIRHASQTVSMDEAPSNALRNKKDSSMRVAINLVREGDADACVSAGNTGALMATARFVLKMLPGIDRPAICTRLPTQRTHTWVLDLGANVDCQAEHLYQFALMGSVLAQSVDGTEQPTIGVLNIGEEEIKGNEQVRTAARLIAESHLNYAGFAEGNDIYGGRFDIIVCDGFVGNIALKTSEGVAKMIATFIREEFRRNLLTRLAGLCALPVLRAFRRRIDPRLYNGASLLGLAGIVIKSHGSADALAFANAIKVAVLEVREGVPERIRVQLGTGEGSRQTV